jgi:F-type H+-transporting ATPase subunit b
MSEFFNDPMFLYAIAFFIFLGLAFKFGRKPALNLIDAEIVKIRDELEQARKLRADAEAMLADYQARQKTALAEAESIIAGAKDDAARMKETAEAELKASLVRHEQQALDRIRVAEAEAAAQVRAAAIDLAMELTRKTLSSQMDDGAASKLIDQAIADMPTLAATKTKAEAA